MGDFHEHLIDSDKQKLLSDEYIAKNYSYINKNRPSEFPDSRSCTFELEVLEGFINYVKNEAQKQGLENVRIKIKMGQYPEGDTDPKLNPEYRGYQTVFLTGNTAGEPGNPDTDPLIPGLEALNYGSLCPPPGRA